MLSRHRFLALIAGPLALAVVLVAPSLLAAADGALAFQGPTPPPTNTPRATALPTNTP
ncbi:MAG: hypothetical protein HRF48_17160, partial [Chloroflexota bacterium]